MTVTSSGDNQPPGGDPYQTTPYQPTPFQPIPGSDPGVPVEPVQPAEPGGGISGRWLVAGLATVLVLVGVIGVILLAGPRPASPSALTQFAPANSAAYIELRLDLPGDQRDKMAKFMSHFPGFADPANFDQKITETLDNLLRTASNGQASWTGDVDPWFSGQVAVFGSLSDEPNALPSLTVALSVKDRTRLDALVSQFGGTSGEYYRDTPIYTMGFGGGAFAVADEAFIAGVRLEDVKAALDVKAGAASGLADNTDFSAAVATLHGDRLAAMWLDGDALSAGLQNLSGMGGMFMPSLPMRADAVAGKVLIELRTEDDHLALTMRTTPGPDSTPPLTLTDGPTTLSERMPADSTAYIGLQDTGKVLKFTIEALLSAARQSGADMSAMVGVEEFLGMPPQDFLDFLDETAISISADAAGNYGGGLIGTVTDESIAAQRMERVVGAVRAAVAFGGLGVPVTIEEIPHGTATLTVFRIEAPPSADMPFSSISYTISDGLLLLGVDDFVANALDRNSSDSLAAQPRFRDALDAAGGDNTGVMYVDLARVRQAIEGQMPDAQTGRYEQEIKPYLAPFSQLIISGSMDGEEAVGRVLLFVE